MRASLERSDAAATPEPLAAALAPSLPGIPDELWARSLQRPVLDMLGRRGKAFRGRLTSLAFRLAGGTDEPPELSVIFEVIHAGSMVVDDIQDDSPVRRGRPALHRLHGLPLALNAGNWMYFAPFALVDRLGLPPPRELELRRRMTAIMLDCHQGQALDLGARIGEVARPDLAAVALAISTLKTGRLMSLAAEAGALVGGGGARLRRALARFGEALGLALQILDDLGDLSRDAAPEKRYEDLRHRRVTWPWALAAARLDAATFATLEGEAIRVGAGEQDPEGLAETLRLVVGSDGRQRARLTLDRALAELRAAVGDSPLLESLRRELERLEVSYG